MAKYECSGILFTLIQILSTASFPGITLIFHKPKGVLHIFQRMMMMTVNYLLLLLFTRQRLKMKEGFYEIQSS